MSELDAAATATASSPADQPPPPDPPTARPDSPSNGNAHPSDRTYDPFGAYLETRATAQPAPEHRLDTAAATDTAPAGEAAPAADDRGTAAHSDQRTDTPHRAETLTVEHPADQPSWDPMAAISGHSWDSDAWLDRSDASPPSASGRAEDHPTPAEHQQPTPVEEHPAPPGPEAAPPSAELASTEQYQRSSDDPVRPAAGCDGPLPLDLSSSGRSADSPAWADNTTGSPRAETNDAVTRPTESLADIPPAADGGHAASTDPPDLLPTERRIAPISVPDDPSAQGELRVTEHPAGTGEPLGDHHGDSDHDNPGQRQPDRFSTENLAPTGMRDATYGRDLLLGSDGRYHFPGDRIDTYRDDNGRAHADNGRFITDDNLPPTKTIDARAHPDLATRRTYDFDGSAAVDEAGRHAVDARQDIAAQRQQLWDDRLAPVADALRPHGVTVDSASVSKNNLLELTLAAAPYLDRAQRAELQNAGSQYAELTDQLVGASERVGTAGGALVVDREFPDARVLSSTDDSRGTPHNIDRVVYLIESAGSVVAIEEKGAGSGLGSRMVENPAEPAGPHIRAEQCSPEYLRHMLQNDKKLGETLGADPDLRAAIQTTINGTDPGNIRYLHVHTSTDGLVTATDYIIDDDRLGRATIRVTGDPRETEGSPEHEIRRGT